MPRVVLRSQNVPGRIGQERMGAAAAQLAAGADVVMNQEGQGMPRAFQEYVAPLWHTDELPEDPGLPIHWNLRRGAVCVEHMSRRAFKDTNVGSWGAGPPVMLDGWTHGVVLRFGDREEDELAVFTGHWVPSAAKKALTAPDRKARDERRELHKLETAQAAKLMRRYPRAVLMGDLNVGPAYPGLAPLNAVAAQVRMGRTHPVAGTPDGAFVRGVRVVSKRRMLRNASDHTPIELVVEW